MMKKDRSEIMIERGNSFDENFEPEEVKGLGFEVEEEDEQKEKEEECSLEGSVGSSLQDAEEGSVELKEVEKEKEEGSVEDSSEDSFKEIPEEVSLDGSLEDSLNDSVEDSSDDSVGYDPLELASLAYTGSKAVPNAEDTVSREERSLECSPEGSPEGSPDVSSEEQWMTPPLIGDGTDAHGSVEGFSEGSLEEEVSFREGLLDEEGSLDGGLKDVEPSLDELFPAERFFEDSVGGLLDNSLKGSLQENVEVREGADGEEIVSKNKEAL